MVYWDDSLFFIPPLQHVKIVRVNVWKCNHLQLAFSPMSNTGRLTAVVHQGDLCKKEVNWAIRHCLSFKCVETNNFVQIGDLQVGTDVTKEQVSIETYVRSDHKGRWTRLVWNVCFICIWYDKRKRFWESVEARERRELGDQLCPGLDSSRLSTRFAGGQNISQKLTRAQQKIWLRT